MPDDDDDVAIEIGLSVAVVVAVRRSSGGADEGGPEAVWLWASIADAEGVEVTCAFCCRISEDCSRSVDAPGVTLKALSDEAIVTRAVDIDAEAGDRPGAEVVGRSALLVWTIVDGSPSEDGREPEDDRTCVDILGLEDFSLIELDSCRESK